jgi:hypothetical protein
MRLTKKSPRTGALLFLPIVLAFGCARAPEAAPPAAKNDKDVTVTLVMQSDGKLMPVPSLQKVSLSKKAGHRARWIYCGEGDLDIKMKAGIDNDPFDGDWEHGSANNCKHVRSPKIRANAREKKDEQPYDPYKYTITVTGVPNTKPNDPDIEIME